MLRSRLIVQEERFQSFAKFSFSSSFDTNMLYIENVMEILIIILNSMCGFNSSCGVEGYKIHLLFDFDIADFNIGIVHHNKRKVHYMQKESGVRNKFIFFLFP